MALAMNFVNEVLRQFPTTVIVDQKDWPELMRLFKFDSTRTECLLDRMTLRPIMEGYAGILQRMGELVAEQNQLKAEVHELERQLETATAPSPMGVCTSV